MILNDHQVYFECLLSIEDIEYTGYIQYIQYIEYMQYIECIDYTHILPPKDYPGISTS